MNYLDKVRVSFHNGNAYAPEGIKKKPFAVFTYDGIVNRELIDKVCQLVKQYQNDEDGDFCNIKISSEDWDC